MTRGPIRVLVVDDSAFMRRVLVKMLKPFEDIEVVATAMDGVFALDKLAATKPDVVTLDLEMPRMDGITALRRIVDEHRLPVVLVSSHTSKGARVTFEALAAGAVDFVTKPEKVFSTPLDALGADLVEKIRVAVRANVRRPPPAQERAPASPAPPDSRALRGAPSPARDVVALAVSTGGPNALAQLLPSLRPDFRPALVIVQHMPEGFTGPFAERLARGAAIEVREAEDGDELRSGVALLAPGGRHLEVRLDGARMVTRLTREPTVLGHRPSADVLFRSVADVAGARAVGVVMTGMGMDGATGMEAIRGAGGHTIAQDEASSVVFGMPRAAIERGVVDRVLPLSAIGEYLNELRPAMPAGVGKEEAWNG